MSSSINDRDFIRSFDQVSGVFLSKLTTGKKVNVDDDVNDPPLVLRDPNTDRLRSLAENVAKTPTTVMLSGETGVGKEVFARYIHYKSPRRDGPFVAINCAALSASLLESELFGHEKGAFSGAVQQHIGVFERADGGTLLLDEVSEMPLELQAKLLRVLQEREVLRVGGRKTTKVDIRIIATTNRDLKTYSEEGHFRQDLYFRLNVFPLHIPALRNRPMDIEPLARCYVTRLARLFGRGAVGLSDEAVAKLESYAFPGNIRELINVVERALILAQDSEVIGAEHIQLDSPGAASEDGGLEECTDVDPDVQHADDDNEHVVQFRVGDDQLTDIRRVIIKGTLDRYDGNRSKAARHLGVSVRTIRNKMRDYEDSDD